jgi:predicted PhzF superfamily epimerase YddE/YHI9
MNTCREELSVSAQTIEDPATGNGAAFLGACLLEYNETDREIRIEGRVFGNVVAELPVAYTSD